MVTCPGMSLFIYYCSPCVVNIVTPGIENCIIKMFIIFILYQISKKMREAMLVARMGYVEIA